MKNVFFALSFAMIFTGVPRVCANTVSESQLPVQSDLIRINQVGYLPDNEKIATIVDGTPQTEFLIRNVSSGEIEFKGTLSGVRNSDLSSQKVVVADFSSLKAKGAYVMEVPGVGISYPFSIQSDIYTQPALRAMKSYYYQRSGTDLPAQYAGEYARKAAIMDDKVLIHPSAASASRPAGTVVNSHGGWYDAGDYGKYIVNSAFAVGMLLNFFEDYAPYVSTKKLNIPESDNSTPDYLDELMYNISWMLTMQDPADGGVYHKLTSINHDGFIAPSEQSTQRYIIHKGVTSSLGFAASMAQASRVMTSHAPNYKESGKLLLEAARRAYAWSKKNPDALYDQDAQNQKYNESMNTGEYQDRDPKDEFFWAATELYIATGEKQYLKDLLMYAPDAYVLPVWDKVSGLGSQALIRHQEQLKHTEARVLAEQQQQMLLNYVDQKSVGVTTTPYQASYGRVPGDFFWACNADACANQGVAYLIAYRLTGKKDYFTNALRNADYLLGRNATGYCYLTGFGSKSPRFPHHRLFATDHVDQPYPGFLVGGPNPGRQDKVTYYSYIPDQAYVDIEAAYACNEIAINWQSFAVYLFGGLDAEMQ
ncbi:MAG: glycoside hydrolase family 9 protein [Bacteroidales bacterium]